MSPIQPPRSLVLAFVAGVATTAVLGMAATAFLGRTATPPSSSAPSSSAALSTPVEMSPLVPAKSPEISSDAPPDDPLATSPSATPPALEVIIGGRTGTLTIPSTTWTRYDRAALLGGDDEAMIETGTHYDDPATGVALWLEDLPVITATSGTDISLRLLGPGKIGLGLVGWYTTGDVLVGTDKNGVFNSDGPVMLADNAMARAFTLANSVFGGPTERIVTFPLSITDGDTIIMAEYEFTWRLEATSP